MDIVVEGLLNLLLIMIGRCVICVATLGYWKCEGLTSNDHSIHGAAGALWYARDGRRVVTPTGQTLAGFLFCIALVLALVGMSMG